MRLAAPIVPDHGKCAAGDFVDLQGREIVGARDGEPLACRAARRGDGRIAVGAEQDEINV